MDGNKNLFILKEVTFQQDAQREKKREKIEGIMKRENILVPQYLYRYRSCVERCFDALEKEELWFSKPNRMNDDYDAMIPYNPNIIKKKISEHFKLLSERMKALRSGQIQDNGFSNLILEKHIETIKEWSEEELKRKIEDGKQQAIREVDNEFPLLATLLQETQKVACFSESITSPLLWGHYAENSSGFALAYKFENTFYGEWQEDKASYTLLPVKYGESPYVSTEENVEEYIYWCYHRAVLEQNSLMSKEQKEEARKRLPCPDESLGEELLFHKSKEWEPEKEWRMACHWEDPDVQNRDYSCIKKKPDALYLGRKIAPANEERLLLLSKEKRIPVYKMEIDYTTYSLQPKLLSTNN